MRKFILAIGDIAILYGALFLALFLRYGSKISENIGVHIVPFSIIFGIWVIVFYITNLYEITTAKNNLGFYVTFAYSILANAVISISFFYLIPFFDIAPKTNLFIFLAFASAAEIGWRSGFNYTTSRSGYRNNVLIIGLSQQAQELYDHLLGNPQLGYGPLGILDVQDISATQIIEPLIRQKDVKILVLDPEVYRIPRIVNILYTLLEIKINFYSLSEFYEAVTGKVPLGTIDQTWFLNNLTEGRKRLYEISKRVYDIAGALAIGIPSLLAYPFIALAVRSSSHGPIFFKQKRKGRAGKIFYLYKFRSMIADSPDGSAEGQTGPKWTTEGDTRVTKVGGFLRRTRLDELPQLWNILRGDMSFVGPRPERPEFHDTLKTEIPFYDERYLIKPGLTGWAQIKYKYGSSIHDAAEKLQYDLYYIKNRSLILDLGIILKTINIVANKAGQ